MLKDHGTDRTNIEDDIDALVDATDREKTLLARQLHDSLAQNLAAASMILSMLERATGPNRREMSIEGAKLLDQCVKEVGEMCFRLSPPLSGQAPLPRALLCLAEAVEKQFGVTVRVLVSGEHRPEERVQAALLRITQDACKALAEAKAREIHVVADIRHGSFELVISGGCELSNHETVARSPALLEARARNSGLLLSLATSGFSTEVRVAAPVQELL